MAHFLLLKHALSKVAPNIESMLSNTDGPLAEPFRELSRPAAEKGGVK